MSERRKLRLRYTLRALFVFITLFMLWGGYHTNRSWQQREAERVLRERGASFHYARHPIEGSTADRIYAIYYRIVQVVWQERSVTWVSLDAAPDDEVVNALAALPRLETLYWQPKATTPGDVLRMKTRQVLHGTHSLPSGALDRILSSTRLRGIAISGWKLSDEDCKAIATRPGMKSIAIDGCTVSEEGFAKLIATPGLISFTFEYCEVSANRVDGSKGSPSLERVIGGPTPASTSLAEFVARSPNVTELGVRWEQGDESVRILAQHPSLTTLGAGETGLTDNCLADIAKMPALKYVFISGPGVSKQGVLRLQALRPQLHIDHR